MIVNGVVIFSMVLEAPSPSPNNLIVGRYHAALPAGSHYFVLAERESRDITKRSNSSIVVSGSVTLGTVFNNLQTSLAS
jgi:hypothetical protein